MQKQYSFFGKIGAFALLFLCLNLVASAQVRVACVGNSITFGSGIKDRAHDSYPAQLQAMLGNGYDVRNFGIGARTLLNKGDHPYMKEPIFRDALAFNPNYVFIKLGTNDSKPQNWLHNADFEADYIALVRQFQALPSKPKIYLCFPATVHNGGNWGINDSTIVADIIPRIRRVAKACHVRTLDLHTPTADISEHFRDHVHPDPYGAKILAKNIFKAIRGRRAKPKIP